MLQGGEVHLLQFVEDVQACGCHEGWVAMVPIAGSGSASSCRTHRAASGETSTAPTLVYPAPSPLERITMSGSQPSQWWLASGAPVCHIPVSTSSWITRTSRSWQISETRRRYPSGGTKAPPVVSLMGSISTAATFSAPRRSIFCAIS